MSVLNWIELNWTDVHDNDIAKFFRIGRKNKLDRNTKPRPILVKFSSVSLKTEVFLVRRRIRKFNPIAILNRYLSMKT